MAVKNPSAVTERVAAPLATLKKTTSVRRHTLSVPAAIQQALSAPAAAQPAVSAPVAVHHARLAPAPIQYAMKLQALQHGWVVRTTNSAVTTANLLASGRGMEIWCELLLMQQALAQRLQQLTQDWFDGLAAWGQEWKQLSAANTMSKMTEQEFNLVGQFAQLMSDQTTGLVNLLESVHVAYGFLISEKWES